MTNTDLDRFVEAQNACRGRVVAELTAGSKQTHWIWFVFPQLAGLGRSETARYYAIEDLDEAKRYLADATLGERLRHDVRLMLRHTDRTAHDILGSPDDAKFRSCLTLFNEAADDPADRELFEGALDCFYADGPDTRTLDLLRGG